jgi:hypothetical protein
LLEKKRYLEEISTKLEKESEANKLLNVLNIPIQEIIPKYLISICL